MWLMHIKNWILVGLSKGQFDIEIIVDACDAICQIHSDLLGLSWNPLDTDHTIYLMIFFFLSLFYFIGRKEERNKNGKQKCKMYI